MVEVLAQLVTPGFKLLIPQPVLVILLPHRLHMLRNDLQSVGMLLDLQELPQCLLVVVEVSLGLLELGLDDVESLAQAAGGLLQVVSLVGDLYKLNSEFFLVFDKIITFSLLDPYLDLQQLRHLFEVLDCLSSGVMHIVSHVVLEVLGLGQSSLEVYLHVLDHLIFLDH